MRAKKNSTTADSNPLNDTEVFNLAIQLVTAQLGKEAPLRNEDNSIRPLDDPSYDILFEGAKRRAEKLLNGPVADHSVIFLEQLFSDSSDPVSTETIRNVLKEWNWQKLMGRKSATEFLGKIECWLIEHLSLMEHELETLAGRSGVAEREFIRAILHFCGRRTGEVMCGPWPESIQRLARYIPPLVSEWCADHQGQLEDMGTLSYDHAWHIELVRWCLGDRYPKDPSQKEEFTITRLYRPWSLFRYLRIYGHKTPGIEWIQDRLQAPRCEISFGITPAPLQDTHHFDFPKFNEIFERKEWVV